MTHKVQVSSDTLYQYLLEHNFTISLLGKRMGVSNGIVCNSFQHVLNRLGKPMKFSNANIERINAVLPQIADELRLSVLTFGSERVYASSRGTIYDPGLIPEVKRLTKYFKLNNFCKRVLGWNVGKKESVLCQPTSGAYGHITQDDVNRINMELLSVAGVLSSYEVAPDDGEKINSDKQGDKPLKTKKVRTGVAYGYEPTRHPWDNTGLDLRERFRLFNEAHPNGILFFRVDSNYKPDPDYTVAYDHASFIAKSFPGISPYTDLASGLVTAVVDEPSFGRIISMLIANSQHYDVTPMYVE